MADLLAAILTEARHADLAGPRRSALGLGIAVTLAANVAHELGHGLVGATEAAWPAVALVGSYELFMTIILSAPQPDHISVPRCGARHLASIGARR